MTGWVEVLAGVASLVFLAVLSMFVEALRRPPKPPEKLAWAPGIPIQYVTVGGVKLRYIKAGEGPNLVLLHTLRTQLDIFQKVIPELSREFTVYAPDYPGHGYSDIPKAEYDAIFFVRAVEGFLDALNVRDVTLCGVSIGGSICLILAGRRNARVSRVIAINPYDYAKGRGMARSSPLGRMIVTTSRIPIVGETVMRLRNFIIMKAVLHGGVAHRESIPPELLEEMYLIGNRPGHYRAFISLLRNSPSWEAAAKVYGNIIGVPVRLVWGDRDWAKQSERERDKQLIPQAETATIENGGHFLPLDQPGAVVGQIREGFTV
jgi:pimeloyl-ACP methyl ester carboxylesterase